MITVQKVNGNIAEVTVQFNISGSAQYGSSNTYDGSTQNALITSWYNSLSDEAKNAIVPKTFRQASWYNSTTGSPKYIGLNASDTAYNISLGNASFGSEITKAAYALSIQDIIDYLEVTPSMTSSNTTLTKNNLFDMVYGQNETQADFWLMDASASNTRAFHVSTTNGNIATAQLTATKNRRPAFQIDLTKIEWTT